MDKWYYKHDGVIHGPVSSDDLASLTWSGDLLPTDLIWPAGAKPSEGVLAEAALGFPVLDELEVTDVEPATAPVPEWLQDLAIALGNSPNPSSLSNPPPSSWLRDVASAEQEPKQGKKKQPPGGKERGARP